VAVLYSSCMATPDQRSTVELLYHVSREIAAAVDLRSVLTRLLFATLKSVGGERGTIIVLDENGIPVDSAIVYGQQARESNTLQLRETVDRGLAGWVVRNKLAALVPDTRTDERWLRRPDDEAAAQTGGKSAICVPLLAHDQLVGVMTLVHSVPNALRAGEFELVQAIADQAGVAVLNAFLFSRLQTAHQRYREFFEASLDPLLITDWQGRVVEANRKAVSITGHKAGSLRGMNIADIHDLRRDRTGEDFAALRSAACTYESDLHQAGGGTVPVEVQAQRVAFEDADLLQWMLRDITERRQLDRLREDLAAMIYHDLRSPLTNIVSSVEILGTMLPTDPATRSAAEAVLKISRHSIDRIQRMINSLLDIHRLEAGQPVGQRGGVSPAELAEDAVKAAAPLAESRNQTLTIDLPATMPIVHVDADMIRRVLINLLENASKYTPLGSQITVGGQPDGPWAMLSVQDDGPGIAPEDRSRIFEKYTRVAQKGNPSGLGVGLAFCRLAVEAHGGRIWLESEPGQGARFSFTLPTK
jgi:two-component system, NtrC family, sensor histidine kinase KinB